MMSMVTRIFNFQSVNERDVFEKNLFLPYVYTIYPDMPKPTAYPITIRAKLPDKFADQIYEVPFKPSYVPNTRIFDEHPNVSVEIVYTAYDFLPLFLVKIDDQYVYNGDAYEKFRRAYLRWVPDFVQYPSEHRNGLMLELSIMRGTSILTFPMEDYVFTVTHASVTQASSEHDKLVHDRLIRFSFNFSTRSYELDPSTMQTIFYLYCTKATSSVIIGYAFVQHNIFFVDIKNFFIFPNFQRKGYGLVLLNAIYYHYQSNPHVHYITASSQNKAFFSLRLKLDVCLVYKMQQFSCLDRLNDCTTASLVRIVRLVAYKIEFTQLLLLRGYFTHVFQDNSHAARFEQFYFHIFYNTKKVYWRELCPDESFDTIDRYARRDALRVYKGLMHDISTFRKLLSVISELGYNFKLFNCEIVES